jgi:hypothetical protein
MQLRPYDLDALTRAVCAHMVRSGISVVMVREGVIQTPDDSFIHIPQSDVEKGVPPSALAELFVCVLKARAH